MKHSFIVLLFCLSLVTTANAQQLKTEVIPLGYRSINEIIPLVRPLVSPDGSVGGLQGQLVVTTTSKKMAEVRKLLAVLDKSPARLLISVKRGKSLSSNQGSASVQGAAGNITINEGGIATGDTHKEHHGKEGNSLSVRLKSNSQNEQSNLIQQVQVLEGREAYISAGEEIPVRNRGVVAGPNGGYGYDSTAFYPATTGFYAIPRLKGDEVFLEINTVSRQRNNLRINTHDSRQGWQSGPNIAVSNVRTTARGKLGEWIAIGGINQSGSSRQSGIGSSSRQQQDLSTQFYVRVVEIRGPAR